MTALTLIPFVAACLAAALPGALFPADSWYAALAKPAWNPPNWLFAPAWAVFYVCIATAGWLAWRAGGPGVRLALAFWALQLVFNAMWSGLFFGLHRMDPAFANLVAMWLSIAATVWLFAQISQPAALLMAPYLAWVTFAGALNLTLWQMNPATA